MTLQHPIPRGFFGITDDRPTGSDRVGSANLELAYDFRTRLDTGLLKDFSGNARHATLTGTSEVDGRFTKARKATAVSDFIRTPSVTLVQGAQTYVIMGTLRSVTPPENGQEVLQSDADNVSGIFRDPDTTWTFRQAAGVFSSTQAAAAGQYVVLIVRQIGHGQDVSWWIDGVNTATAPQALASVTGTLRLADYFDFDEFMYFSRGLTDSEVKALSFDGRENLYVSSTDSDLGTVRPRRIA